MTEPKGAGKNDDARATAEAIDQAVRESQTDLQPPKLDWAKVDDVLFARIEEDRAQRLALAEHGGHRRVWGPMVALVAAAAAVVLLSGRPSGSPVAAPAHAQPAVAGSLAATQGAGEVRLAGATGETVLRSGGRVEVRDVVSTRDTRALFEASGRVSWLLEDGARVVVERAGTAAIVLALEHGAVEAQVSPVSTGEAFAIDVGSVRIAVHGTHLRVDRDGDRVVVDLNEGVVSIGAPPKIGSTYGTLVTAPAHVEFAIGDMPATLRIDHALASVRRALELGSFAPSTAALAPLPTARSGEPAQVASRPSSTTRSTSPRVSSTQDGSVLTQQPEATPEETISAAVRACAVGRLSEITVAANSILKLEVKEDGSVRLAVFDPPLQPDIQSCAATTIFKTHFAESGEHKIPIALRR